MLPLNLSRSVAELHAPAMNAVGRKSSVTENNLARIVPSTVMVSRYPPRFACPLFYCASPVHPRSQLWHQDFNAIILTILFLNSRMYL